MKCKRKVFNPYIGYLSVEDNKAKFGTEGIGLWYNRQFLDSIVFREDKDVK